MSEVKTKVVPTITNLKTMTREEYVEYWSFKTRLFDDLQISSDDTSMLDIFEKCIARMATRKWDIL